MKVPDALVALSSIRRGGRVILAGDDRQLPPILHGRYPREDTLFGSAFAHFAERFGRFQLRESRRMNRALVRWPRRLFYPGFVSMDPRRRLALAAGRGGSLRSAGRAAVGRVPVAGRCGRLLHVRGHPGDGAQRGGGVAGGADRAAGAGGDAGSGDGGALHGRRRSARTGWPSSARTARRTAPSWASWWPAAGRATSCPWSTPWSGCRGTSAS